MGVLAALTMTVLVPWLLGQTTLRDNLFRGRSTDVYDTSFRTLGDYFLSDYLAGTAALTVLAGAAIAVRNISTHRALMACGLVIGAIGAAVLVPISSTKWSEAEAHTAARLAEGPPADVAECRFNWPANPGWTTSESIGFADSDGLRHVWRPIVVATASESHAERCTSVEIFDGAKRIAASQAITDVESGSVALWRGEEPANSYLAYALSANPRDRTLGELGVIRLSDGAMMWSKRVDLLGGVGSNYNGPALAVVAGALVIEHVVKRGFESEDSEIVGYDLATGDRAWHPSCPRGFTADTLYPSDEQAIGATLYCRSPDQTDSYTVDRVDGTLRPYEE